MKSILSILLVGLSIFSFGQDTKKVKNKISKDKYEVFYVLKSDETSKHGIYELYEQKKLKVSGYYKLNQKDSIWTEYKYSKNRVSQGTFLNNQKSGNWTYFHPHTSEEQKYSQGEYSNGKRIKIWNFYSNEGKLIQQFDFNHKKLTTLDTTYTKSPFLIVSGQYKGLMCTDKRASYKGGDSEFFQFLGKSLIYPPKAKSAGIQGKVYVSFSISELGKVSDFKILRSVHKILDDEAIRVLKLTSGKWLPASFEGENVGVRYITPISFTLR